MFKPGKRLSLVGKYSRNPEDKSGSILAQDSRSIGLKTDIGDVSLSGAINISEDLATQRKASAREIGLSLRAFNSGQLTTQYKESLTDKSGLVGTKTYSLGYTHKPSSDFNFSISGVMTQFEQDRRFLNTSRTFYEAQAKIGLRF